MIAEIVALSCLGMSWGYLGYDYYNGDFSTGFAKRKRK